MAAEGKILEKYNTKDAGNKFYSGEAMNVKIHMERRKRRRRWVAKRRRQ